MPIVTVTIMEGYPEDFRMCFPGGARFATLEELVEFASDRYRSIRKSYERCDVGPGLDETVVYCSGTLSGTWPDGRPFEGIRFIDRFAMRNGLLASQELWNDLVEHGARS